MKVKLRKSGKVLFVQGPRPKKKGDKFRATDRPPPRKSKKAPREGCTFGDLPGGGRFISCRRGGSGLDKGDIDVVRVREYRYDPEIHEIVNEGSP